HRLEEPPPGQDRHLDRLHLREHQLRSVPDRAVAGGPQVTAEWMALANCQPAVGDPWIHDPAWRAAAQVVFSTSTFFRPVFTTNSSTGAESASFEAFEAVRPIWALSGKGTASFLSEIQRRPSGPNMH